MSVRPPYHAPPMRPLPGTVAVHAGFGHPHRPIGIAILSVLVVLIGVGALVIGLIVLLAPTIALGPLGGLVTIFGENVFTLGPLGGAGMFLGGFILLSVANGLWHQELWALALCAVALFAAEAVIFFYFLPFTYLFFVLLGLFVYLLAVRKSFS